ncbi:MAG: response regulator [Calditrichaeota bacterium]|nr:MAG: response regulator [Calditrichota bacterium]
MRTILLVENDPYLQLLYELELSELGYRVITAGSTQIALKMAGMEKPDLLIIDPHLPEREGKEDLHKLVKTQPDIPVIINSIPHPQKRARRTLPWAVHVTKSSDLTELKRTVNRLLSDSVVQQVMN